MVKAVVPARGMRDILPKDKAKRDAILDTIRATYRRNGFTEIETPAIEPLSRLRSNQGGENESMLFEILRRGLDPKEPVAPADATDLALRYDLTVPLTRFYASHAAELPSVFRSLQIGSVWRAERPQKGRFRQFTQCDIDVIGEAGILAEVDLLVSTLQAFDALGMGDDVTLLVNDRRVLQDLLEAAGVEAASVPETLIALDKLDKIGPDGVAAEVSRKGLADDDVVRRLLDTITALQDQAGPEDAPLRTGRVDVGGTEVGLYDLPAIVAAVVAVLPDARVAFDASLVRGMGYYTGPIFEIRHTAGSGSVAGGGRYDAVVGKWLGRDVPACGFSIGFERIIDLLPDPVAAARRIALLHGDADPAELLRLREGLQADGASVTLVRPPRKVSGTFFDGLVAQGFTHVADARPGQDPHALRELSRP
ncbi:histidine--tRNA ligase [Cellulomonas carbonis]|uniref:Histidyl-tRNA synthetase n=1 Tax=Cellulomonas carbonis T26 TaxID=947969 RepID=A0A0A0BRK7_9CELL|nr:ATP phosphoribosyltransferase regulatory subunit [Cellulomonas carbonis]KGM10611.1 histidyl-tRNA synthetase [Cellulomonas carbonis T26]GGC07100.1 histidine--tRNA ligase [Cellulomonas carbonis]